MNKLTKESAMFFAGTFIPAALGFISTPIFTRYFTTSEYGVNTLIDTSFGYLNILLFGLISNIVWRYYNDYKNKGEIDIFFGLVSTLARTFELFIVAVVSCISLFSRFDGYAKCLIGAKAISVITVAYVSIYLVILFLDGKVAAYNVIQIFNAISNFAVIYLLTKFFGMRNIAMYISTIFYSLCSGAFLAWHFRKRKKTYLPARKTIAILLPMISYGVVAILTDFTHNILDSSDRYMVSLARNVSAVGIYDKLYNISNYLLVLFITVFTNIFSPHVFRHLSKGDAKDFFKALLPVYVGVFLPLVLYYAVFSNTICSILLPKEYAAWHFILSLISLGCFFDRLVGFFPMMILRFSRPWFMAVGYGLAVLLNLILNAVLIPHLSLLGAAIGTVASYFAVFLFSTVATGILSPEYFFKKGSRINLLFLIPLVECIAYLLIKKNIALPKMSCVVLAVLLAASYFGPYLYYTFVRNKEFIQLFEDNE